jgi:hypothetical protein
MPLLRIAAFASFNLTKQWLPKLHGPSGIVGSLESGETHFVPGMQAAADVLSIPVKA